MKDTPPSPAPPRDLRVPLYLILAVMLLRLGMDHSPFGKTEAAPVVGLVALYAGFGLLFWTFVLAIRNRERSRD
jgi:hypothetical protein